MSFFDKLRGNRTYLTALLGAGLGVWQATGHEVPAWVFAILGSLGLGFLRAGFVNAITPAPAADAQVKP